MKDTKFSDKIISVEDNDSERKPIKKAGESFTGTVHKDSLLFGLWSYQCKQNIKHNYFGKSVRKEMLLARFIVCTRTLTGNLRLWSVMPNMSSV